MRKRGPIPSLGGVSVLLERHVIHAGPSLSDTLGVGITPHAK